MKAIIDFCARRDLPVNLVTLMLLLGGIYAAFHMQREAFPAVNFDVLVVDARHSGAAPEEIESRLLVPIERELRGLEGINRVTSTAFQDSMQMLIEVDPSYADRARLVAEVQQAIERADLPADLPADPLITEVKSEQTPIVSFALFGNLSELDLQRMGRRIEDEVLAVSGVARLLVQGDRKQEIRVVLDPERMRAHRVTVGEIGRLLRGWNVTAPGGRLQAPGGQRLIRITGEFTSAEDVAALVIRANERGDALRIGDVARVVEALERPHRQVRVQGMPALNMTVLKKGDADLIAVVDRVRGLLADIPDRYPGVGVAVYGDFSTMTRLRLGVLTGNGALGLALVLGVLLIGLRPAVALSTAWGLPIIFFGGLALLYLGGVTLNMLTTFAFILVLGLIVDDSIIVGENADRHLALGLPPREAAVAGATELLGPVTTTVATTALAFLPLMFMDGIIGKFMFVVPLVVVTLLALSWLEALLVMPAHIAALARPRARTARGPSLPGRIYRAAVRMALRWRYLTVALTIVALGASWQLAGQMKFQLFPYGAESQFYLRVALPAGTTLEQTRDRLLELERAARERIDPSMLEATIVVAGESSADQRDVLKRRGDRFGYLRVILVHFTEREAGAHAVMEDLRLALAPLFPDLEIAFTMEAMGPPVGRALQASIYGGDDTARAAAAQRLLGLLRETDGVHAVQSDLDPGDQELRIVVDRARAAWVGIDLATVADHVRAAFDGLPVATVIRGRDEMDITLRFPEEAGRDPRTLLDLEVPAARGGLVPLRRIVRLEEAPGVTVIRHDSGERIVTVSAEVDRSRITAHELNRLVREQEAQWLGTEATGMRYTLGGEQERSEESVSGLMFSLGFALLGIFVLLAVQFNGFAWPLLVMFAIPFGMIGVVAGFHLHEQPLSFMALTGFVALTGIVVNFSLVMAVFIQRLLRAGTPWREAIVEGSHRRLRAVLLTAVTTIVGLLPTAYGWGGHDPFVAPMALALSWGLMSATVITLFSVPAALGIGMDIRSLLSMARRSRRAAPESSRQSFPMD